MEEFVKFLVLSLVQNKNDVLVTKSEQNDECVLTVKVNEQDLGRVIGKNGKNAQAIRTLVNAYAKQQGSTNKHILKFE